MRFMLLAWAFLLALAQTSVAQIDPGLNPLFRPKGAIVNKGSARYYIWYEGATWHIRSTAPQLAKFFGGVAVDKGKITYCRLIGKEAKQDYLRFSPDRKSISFTFHTSTLSDGLDLKISGAEDAKISFSLGFGKKKQISPQLVFIGAKQQRPKRLPLVFPAKPNRTMYAPGSPTSLANRIPIPADPILLLTFDAKSFGEKEGKPVIWDYSSKQNASKLYQASLGVGKVGDGLAFDPSASGIYTPIRQSQAKTIALWVKLKEIGPFRSIVSGGGKNKGFSINLKSNGKCNLTYGTGTTYMGVGGPHALSVGQWAHVASVIDTKARKFSYYVNGVHRHTGPIQKPIAGLDECKLVFSVNWKGHALNGDIDEVAVYDRVLTAQEVATLHAAGAAGVSLTQAKR